MGHSPSTPTRIHHHTDSYEPVWREGCPMSSIVYLVGAVVIIVFVLKMIGIY